MIKLIGALVAAALVATIAVTLPVPEVSANTPDRPGAQQPAVKGDRLAVRVVGPACSPRAWPYYDRGCLFETRWQGEGRTVRVVSTDKIVD